MSKNKPAVSPGWPARALGYELIMANRLTRFSGYFSIVLLILLSLGACDRAENPTKTEPTQTTASAGKQQVSTASGRDVSTGSERMVKRLRTIAQTTDPMKHSFLNEQRLAVLRGLDSPTDMNNRIAHTYRVANELLKTGQSEDAAAAFQQVLDMTAESGGSFRDDLPRRMRSLKAVSLLRLGEQANCLMMHGAASCLFPISIEARHKNQQGSRAAMKELEVLLTENPDDLASRWLYNLAAQTVGDHPDKVPAAWLIPAQVFASDIELPSYRDIAPKIGLDTIDLAGGSIIEDFNGDGLLDVMASAWGMRGQLRLFLNQREAGFKETTGVAGLTGIVGGLNIVQADYDNDGDQDVLVLRGAWLVRSGRHPNSLLRNNGHGVFEDVTEEAGLLSFHPTQAGAWADYDNDGWLDLYIANEVPPRGVHPQPAELYHNNGDGSFSEVAQQTGLALGGFAKGVSWGDYDNDGWQDLFVSRLGNDNLLYHNEGKSGKHIFREVAEAAGVTDPQYSFPTWFWDYDNDGWLDIFVADFAPNQFGTAGTPSYSENQIMQIASDYLCLKATDSTARLFRNNHDGTFADVTEMMNLDHPMLAMGANFGDIDNDGFLDIYLGTGAPDFRALVPNRMFRNDAARVFQDVTTTTATGHLQKGHGISFGDIDNDGDQDILAVMGGAYSGDVYQNVLFSNPGHGNHWITLRLQGTHGNRSAIGARIHLTVETPGGPRDIYATVSSGGSFGASSLQQEIGLGDATAIRQVEINWPAGKTQVFPGLPLDQVVALTEGQDKPRLIVSEAIKFR